jgi:hypothetical protein
MMIKLCYPKGCYGNYLGQCLYYFTNLRANNIEDFSLDIRGSSHAFFANSNAHQYIQAGHHITDTDNSWPNITVSSADVVVSIVPLIEHWLDYQNNHFLKHFQGDVIKNISVFFSIDEINHKLTTYWEYHNGFGSAVPTWILREFFSLCIGEVLHNTYNRPSINNSITVTTQDFFENFLDVFKNLCNRLQLTVSVDDDVILQNNIAFITAQRYHNSQIVCEQWIQCVVDNKLAILSQPTFFDEAYIQHRLRQFGYEIRCNGLDIFPYNSQDLFKLIYKI